MRPRTVREILNEEVRVTTSCTPPPVGSIWSVTFGGVEVRRNVSRPTAKEIAQQIRHKLEDLMREAVEREQEQQQRVV